MEKKEMSKNTIETKDFIKRTETLFLAQLDTLKKMYQKYQRNERTRKIPGKDYETNIGLPKMILVKRSRDHRIYIIAKFWMRMRQSS